ncbi:SWIM zinc finger family protein [Streptomyces sp. RK9]|uniref:SWIM zinc finger family protein n=1 Tax=Streptomyces sp. RK9 TaxID=3239284 RepID=UPI00386E4CC3
MSSAPGDGARSPMFPGVGGGARSRVFPALPPRTDPDAPFASTWWGNAWIAALEDSALDPARLARGRAYAREGHVDTITVEPGRIRAYVHGSRPRPYRAELRMRTLTPADWDRLLDAAVADPAHLTALLTRDMPQALATTADHTGVPLLPGHGDLVPTCTCPDRGHPCKHAAALTYQTARILDADPFVLLLVRGAEETRVLDELARRNAHFAAREAGARAGVAVRGEVSAPPDGEASEYGAASDDGFGPVAGAGDGFGRAAGVGGAFGPAAGVGDGFGPVAGAGDGFGRAAGVGDAFGPAAGVGDGFGPAAGAGDALRASTSGQGDAARPSDAARRAIRSAARAGEGVRPGAEGGDGVRPAAVAGDVARPAGPPGDVVRPSDAVRAAVRGARAGDAVRSLPDEGDATSSTSAAGGAIRPSDAARKAVRGATAGKALRPVADDAATDPTTPTAPDATRPTADAANPLRPKATPRPSDAARNAIRRPPTPTPARQQQDNRRALQHPENASLSEPGNPLPSVSRSPLPSKPTSPLPGDPTATPLSPPHGTPAPRNTSAPQGTPAPRNTPAPHPQDPATPPPTPPSLPGTPARDALTSDYRPPLPPPFPVPPHPGEPPLLPAVPGAPDPTALEFLATDAVARAHAYLRWGESPFAADAWLDAVRLAASHPGLTGRRTFSRQFAELAASVGRTPADLSRAAAAWRQGGEEGLTVLESPWDPPAGPFDRARGALAAAGLPRMTIQQNHLTDPTGAHQIRYGHDGRWYPYRAEPHTGPADWWPDGAADEDPVGALTSLLGP